MKFLFLTISIIIQSALSLDNGLARTPAMGWNSWNKFACNINETLIKDTADKIVSTGLASFGYVYVNLDDCWQFNRDWKTFEILPDPTAFPSGMKALGEYIHGKGLKYGLYSSAGIYTCQMRPGGLFFENIDARSYADWGVDYLKYDNCYNLRLSPKWRYPRMRDALNKTGRPIYYSLCEWGDQEPWKWGAGVGNSWRTTADIKNNWKSVMEILELQAKIVSFGAPGGWNDPDMLEVGNGGMTVTEEESHFSLWALMKAPLIIGCDVSSMTNDTFRILTNKEIIDVNQDALGKSAIRYLADGDKQVWGGPVIGGFVVLLFNAGDKEVNIKADFSLFNLIGKQNVRDLWQHADLNIHEGFVEASVLSHGVKVFKLTQAEQLNTI